MIGKQGRELRRSVRKGKPMSNRHTRYNRAEFAAALRAEHMPMPRSDGTSKEQLLVERTELTIRLRQAWGALLTAAPNERDYTDAGQLRSAIAVHRRRLDVLRALIDDVKREIKWISEADAASPR
jgi:hypothetical protein